MNRFLVRASALSIALATLAAVPAAAQVIRKGVDYWRTPYNGTKFKFPEGTSRPCARPSPDPSLEPRGNPARHPGPGLGLGFRGRPAHAVPIRPGWERVNHRAVQIPVLDQHRAERHSLRQIGSGRRGSPRVSSRKPR